MFEYLTSAQYVLAITGLVLLAFATLAYRNEKRLALSLFFLLLGTICLRWFAITLDPFLNVWDEQYHALVARNSMAHPFKPMLYQFPYYSYNYRSWIDNHIWLHKQPLFIWQMALSLKIFGINEIALRFPGFVMMTLSTLMIFRIGSLVSGAKTGLYAAILFTTMFFSVQLVSGFEATDHNDVAFLFYVTASFWGLAEYTVSQKRKWIYLIGIFAGFAVLNKWLTGLMVFGSWFIALILTHKRPFSFKIFIPLFISLLIALVVFLPWQIFIALQYPLESSWERSLNLLHVFSAVEGHSGNQWFHLNAISTLYNKFVPYIIIPGFIFLVRDQKNFTITTGLITAVIMVYTFFSIVVTKMTAFTFPVSGIFCLAIAAVFTRLESTLVAFSRKLFFLFFFLFTSFFYFNFNFQDIEKLHGSKKLYPQRSYFVNYRTHESKFFKQISKTIDESQKPIVFNVPILDCPMLMFYTGATAYDRFPSSADIDSLEKEGRKIYILSHEPLEEFEKNNSVTVIRYPENIEVSRKQVAFRFSNGKILSYEQQGSYDLIVNRDNHGLWETFTLIQYLDSSYSIMANNNTYLSVRITGDESVFFGATLSREWEHFKIEQLPNGKSAIKDCNNSYIFLKDDAHLHSGKKKYEKDIEVEIIPR